MLIEAEQEKNNIKKREFYKDMAHSKSYNSFCFAVFLFLHSFFIVVVVVVSSFQLCSVYLNSSSNSFGLYVRHFKSVLLLLR